MPSDERTELLSEFVVDEAWGGEWPEMWEGSYYTVTAVEGGYKVTKREGRRVPWWEGMENWG